MNETLRKEIKLEGDSRQITVKLWDEHANLPVKANEFVLIRNLRTATFKGITSLNSTDETAVEVCYSSIL